MTLERGAVPLRDLAGTAIHALTAEGWLPATVLPAGPGPVRLFAFAPARVDAQGRAAALRSNHRIHVLADCWPEDGPAISLVTERDSLDPVYTAGLVHGLVFGDGWLDRVRERTGEGVYRIRLCRGKHKLAGFFPQVTFPPSCGEDPVATITSPRDLKAPPPPGDPQYAAGFVHGWTLADGHWRGRSCTLSTTDATAVEWMALHAPIGGLAVTGHSLDSSIRTNLAARRNVLHRLTAKRVPVAWKLASVHGWPGRTDRYRIACELPCSLAGGLPAPVWSGPSSGIGTRQFGLA